MVYDRHVDAILNDIRQTVGSAWLTSDEILDSRAADKAKASVYILGPDCVRAMTWPSTTATATDTTNHTASPVIMCITSPR
jgi:hypothetical protein